MKKLCFLISSFLLSLLFLLPFIGIFFNSLNLKMWRYVLCSSQTYRSLLMTFSVVILTIVINFVIGTPVAYFMAREFFKGKIILNFIIILPLIIPTMVSTMGIQYAFIRLNLIETIIGVAIVHSIATMPYYIQSMRTGYLTLNKDYISLGKVLGANAVERFFKITLPIIYPSFLVGVSFIIIISLAQYLGTLIIGGGQIITLPILMMPYLVDGGVTNGTVYSIIYIVFTYILIFLIEKIFKNIYRKREYR